MEEEEFGTSLKVPDLLDDWRLLSEEADLDLEGGGSAIIPL